MVGYVRLVQIHGCIKFNLSLNGCHGRCNSFAIANTDDVKRTLGLGDSSKFGRDHWSIESKSIQSAIQMNDLSAKGQVSINRRQFYQSDNHENKQDPPSNSFKSENRMNHTNFRNSNQDKFNSHSSERRGRNIAKKSHSRFRNILKPLESHEASYQDGEIEYNRLIGKTSGLHSEAKDIVSISRCCAMKGKPKFVSIICNTKFVYKYINLLMQSCHDQSILTKEKNLILSTQITIKLMCTDGWRSLVFAEAQDCHCSSCSAVD